MKDKLITFAIIFVGSFAPHYFFFARDHSIGEMLFISAGPAAIMAFTLNYTKRLEVYILNKIFKQKAH